MHVIARLLLILGSLALLHPVALGDETIFSKHPSAAPGVDSEPVLELYVSLSDKVAIGPSDDGERFIVPITGGYFVGKDIAGEVMSGGADWQVVRSDGVKTITAIYSIRTDDGQVIVVDNRGMTFSEDGETYKRTIPKFHAPVGKYDWLNKSLFTGTITSIREPRAVIIRVYKID